MENAASLSSTENRLHFLDYWRIIRVRKLVILAVFLLVVTTTTVVTLWLPKTYASKARIQVDKDKRDGGGLASQDLQLPYDYNFMQTQFERLQSRLILDPVIGELGLSERWARRYGRPAAFGVSETVEMLQERMDLRLVRNTSYIEIRVFSEEPEEAAEIANKIATVYKKHREDRFQNVNQDTLGVFQKRLAEQVQIVTNLQNKVDTLRQDLSINDQMAGNDTYVTTSGPEYEIRAMADQATAFAELLSASNKLHQIEGKPIDELRYILGTIHPDQNLPPLLHQYSMAEQELVSKREIYGEEHDEVKVALATLNKVGAQLDKVVSGIMVGLRAQKDTAFNVYTALTNNLEKVKRQDIEMATKTRPYYEAKQELRQQRDHLVRLEQKVLLESVDSKLSTDSMVEITDPAVISDKPVRPNIPLNIAASIIVGLIAGIGLAFFIEYLDTSVKTIDDIEQVLQTPVLSVIPQGVTNLVVDGPEGPNAEAYRVLRTNVLFGRKNDTMNTITVVSGGAAEGKSTTLLNLAVVLAQNESRVLLVDTDLRRPSLHKALGVSNSVGLTNYLMKQKSLEEVILKTPVEGLEFLPSGRLPSSALGILNSPRFHEFVQEIKKQYDYVLFDAPPVLGVSDASILIREAAMTLLVLQHRKYPQAMNVRAKQTIDKFGGNLLGVVLNNINLSTDSYYYYYSGFGYGYTNQNQDEDKPAKPNGKAHQPASESEPTSLKQKY